MSSHVLVGDGSPGRTHKIMVTPTTPLATILQEGCKKFNMSSEGRTLKKANTANPLDMSLTVKLANLPSGARLEIIRQTRAAQTALVTIGLQIMDGTPRRLTGKFPAGSTLWQVLRTLEKESSTGGQPAINLTERAASAGTKNEGRLMYVRPVVQVMNRDLCELEEFAMTLGSLGIAKGSHLFRVKFQPTQIPFEKALGEIAMIFGGEEALESSEPVDAAENSKTEEKEEVKQETPPDAMEVDPIPKSEPKPPTEAQAPEPSSSSPPAPASSSSPPPGGISVFRATASHRPSDSAFNEADYEIDANRAQIHQKHLQEASRNQRLLSDREIEERKKEKELKAKTMNVEVRVRFPDQLIIQKTFKGSDTAADLYTFIKGCLRYPSDDFNIYLSPPHRTIRPDYGALVSKCGFSSRTLVYFSWNESVSKSVKDKPALKDEFVKMAGELPVPLVGGTEEKEEKKSGGGFFGGGGSNSGGGQKKGGGGGGGPKLPKWLTLGKK